MMIVMIVIRFFNQSINPHIYQIMFYEFKNFRPVVHPSSFVHPQAAVTGNVIIGKDVYIGPGAAIRGDWGGIVIADGCNVQENCTIHMFPGVTVQLEAGAHIGHGAIIHGAHVSANVMVGMNSVIMDNVVLGANSIIGALTFVKANTIIPERSLVVGNPGKVIREGTQLYQTLPGDCFEYLEACEPLQEVPENRPDQATLFKTWDEIKKK